MSAHAEALLNLSGQNTEERAQPLFPTVVANDLNGRSLILPQELPAEVTIVLVGFEREQQIALDTWVKGLDLAGRYAGRWIELPVVGLQGADRKASIEEGMRCGIPNVDDRARTITVFQDRNLFLKSLGLSGTEAVYLFLVRRNGDVLLTITGPYSCQGADLVQRFLDED